MTKPFMSLMTMVAKTRFPYGKVFINGYFIMFSRKPDNKEEIFETDFFLIYKSTEPNIEFRVNFKVLLKCGYIAFLTRGIFMEDTSHGI